MNHGSFFSGIGGFELAAQWMGWNNKFHCEINPFGQKVLKYYWPESEHYSNIKESNFEKHRGTIDVLSGGFPCQPYSSAGKRLGNQDDRHLWPEMLRGIREISPRWVVGENVRGLTNWNGGLVFDEVQADLENEGYEVTPFLLPACGVGAPHRRDRIWFVAYASDNGSHSSENRQGNCQGNDYYQTRQVPAFEFEGCCREAAGKAVADTGSERRQQKPRSALSNESQNERWSETHNYIFNCDGESGAFTNSDSQQRRERWMHEAGREAAERHSRAFDPRNGRGAWENFPTQSPVRSGNDGFPPRLDGITLSKWRNESIKAAGNAIVPQVAYQIFKAIQQYEETRV